MSAVPNRPAVLAALDSLLSWPEIARSPQLARFLDYIVRRTLDGDEQSIKAYSIAVDVFGRAGDFDPQADPIVRVQARRLRGLLEQYNASEGADDEVRITLPIGRYVPLFEARTPVAEAPAMVEPTLTPTVAPALRPRGHITLSWLALLAITIGIAILAYALSNWEPRPPRAPVPATIGPSTTVVEFQDLSGDGYRPVVAGLALELVTDLAAFEDIDARYGGAESPALPQPGVTPSDFVLTGIVRRADRAMQYSAILTETASGVVVWNRTIAIDEQRSTQPDALDEISQRLSLVLGSPRGPLHLPAREALSGGLSEKDATLYRCRVLFDLYREAGTPASGVRAADCFARLSETERQAPAALAAEASLSSEGMVATGAPVLGLDARLRVAEASLDRATALAPLSGFVWEQKGRWLELQGRFDAATAAYASSIQLNPANADALAAAARLLALQGNLEEAGPLASEAVSGSPTPPPWYYLVPILQALHDGRLPVAISNAQTYSVADPELGSVLAVVAASAASNARVVNRYLPQVLEVSAFRAAGILPRLRERVGDAALLNRIAQALASSGVPQRALAGPF